MSHSSPLTIRLIRHIPSDSKEDDIIHVKRNSISESYDMDYTDSCPDGKKIIQHFQDLPYTDVVNYLKCVLQNSLLDEEGFNMVQFDAVGMPRFLVSVNNLKKPPSKYQDSTINQILTTLETTLLLMKNQIKNQRTITPPPIIRRRRAGFYDASPMSLDFADE